MAPRKTAEEKAEAKKIKAEQEELIADTYADIAAVQNILRSISPAVQAAEVQLTQQFDALPLNPTKKAAAKAISVPYQSLRELRANINALELMVDEFKEDLTKEWKSEQKKSLEKREVYLKKKVVEMNDISKRFNDDVKRNMKGAGVRIPGWEDDGEEAEEEEVEEDEEGGEEGDGAEVKAKDQENQVAGDMKGKGRVESQEAEINKEGKAEQLA